MDIKSIPNHELERLKQKAQEISGSKTEYQNEYSTLLTRRLNHEPIQYIEEFMPFYTVQLKVDERALIPRPETEYLIEIIKNKVVKPKSILDVGTGSGCIILSVLNERRKCTGVGIDISKKALKLAKYNAKIQQVSNRIRFIKSDVDKFLLGKKGETVYIIKNE